MDLYLAWDFTVSSDENIAERMLQIRDDAFADLGDENLGDVAVQEDAPEFTVTSVENFTSPRTRAGPAGPGHARGAVLPGVRLRAGRAFDLGPTACRGRNGT